MDFQKYKKDILNRLDKSKAKEVDKPILDLIDLINKITGMCTTSSCAGRTVLLRKVSTKESCEWVYKTHEEPEADVAWQILENSSGNVWLLFEDIILHICCETYDIADAFMQDVRSIGFKHSGIISSRKGYVVEIIGNERIETPVMIEDELIISSQTFNKLILECKKKLEKNRKKIRKLLVLFTQYN